MGDFDPSFYHSHHRLFSGPSEAEELYVTETSLINARLTAEIGFRDFSLPRPT